MKTERTVTIEGIEYGIVISDESEALLAAKAAGRAILGLLRNSERSMDAEAEGACANQDLSMARYLVESLEDVDERLLEQVVRRHLGRPWRIAETTRLIIREFQLEDAAVIPREETDTKEDRMFQNAEELAEYIRCQYGFYEFGVWALVDKATGQLVGKAGLTVWEEMTESAMGADGVCETEEDVEKCEKAADLQADVCLELGYHIFEPYRRHGYAVEACQAILEYAKEQWENCRIYAKIDASNEASIGVIKACGFTLQGRTCSGALQYSYPCGPCWR